MAPAQVGGLMRAATPTRRVAALLLTVAVLGLAIGPSDAQRPPESERPPNEQRRPRASPPPLPPAQVATICSNEAGWCPLPEGVVIVTGTPCQCFVPGQGYVDGVARYFNYAMYPDRPVSPYFNPHWTDAPPLLR